MSLREGKSGVLIVTWVRAEDEELPGSYVNESMEDEEAKEGSPLSPSANGYYEQEDYYCCYCYLLAAFKELLWLLSSATYLYI